MTFIFIILSAISTYSVVAWPGLTQSNVDRINKLQKRCVRIFSFSGFKEHTNGLFF